VLVWPPFMLATALSMSSGIERLAGTREQFLMWEPVEGDDGDVGELLRRAGGEEARGGGYGSP
jgi:hypothetical protein